MVIIIWYPASPSRITVLMIKNTITNCYKIKKEKKREKLRDKRKQESIAITWLTEKGAKTLQSIRKVAEWMNEWMNETAPKWTYKHKVWGKSSNYGLRNVVRVFDFSWKIVVIIVQSFTISPLQLREFKWTSLYRSFRTTLTTFNHVFVWSN